MNTLVWEYLELILDWEKGIWLVTDTVGGRSKIMMVGGRMSEPESRPSYVVLWS